MLLDGYQHEVHSHCETGSILNVLRYNGIQLSEPMIFGIGSGISFVYLPFVKINHVPISAFRRLPGKIFSRVCKQLDIEFELKTYSNPAKAMDELDRVLDKGIPANLQVGVYHLNYFPPEGRLHYNIHTMSVVGKENGDYLVSDSIFDGIQKVPYEEMKRVRYAPGAFTPHGKMYWITKVPENIDLHQPIVNGIKISVREMIGYYFWLIGTKGIRYFSDSFRKWPEKLGEKTSRQYLLQQIQMLEIAGTGGSGYRYIYGAFLKESAAILKQDWINDVAVEMGQVGNRWREFSHIAAQYIKTRENFHNSFNEMADILLDISDKEHAIFYKLKKVSQ
ncbi:MAG: BtrH N-terminal domain-containing protein [Bacteroidota bacterium]